MNSCTTVGESTWAGTLLVYNIVACTDNVSIGHQNYSHWNCFSGLYPGRSQPHKESISGNCPVDPRRSTQLATLDGSSSTCQPTAKGPYTVPSGTVGPVAPGSRQTSKRPCLGGGGYQLASVHLPQM